MLTQSDKKSQDRVAGTSNKAQSGVLRSGSKNYHSNQYQTRQQPDSGNYVTNQSNSLSMQKQFSSKKEFMSPNLLRQGQETQDLKVDDDLNFLDSNPSQSSDDGKNKQKEEKSTERDLDYNMPQPTDREINKIQETLRNQQEKMSVSPTRARINSENQPSNKQSQQFADDNNIRPYNPKSQSIHVPANNNSQVPVQNKRKNRKQASNALYLQYDESEEDRLNGQGIQDTNREYHPSQKDIQTTNHKPRLDTRSPIAKSQEQNLNLGMKQTSQTFRLPQGGNNTSFDGKDQQDQHEVSIQNIQQQVEESNRGRKINDDRFTDSVSKHYSQRRKGSMGIFKQDFVGDNKSENILMQHNYQSQLNIQVQNKYAKLDTQKSFINSYLVTPQNQTPLQTQGNTEYNFTQINNHKQGQNKQSYMVKNQSSKNFPIAIQTQGSTKGSNQQQSGFNLFNMVSNTVRSGSAHQTIFNQKKENANSAAQQSKQQEILDDHLYPCSNFFKDDDNFDYTKQNIKFPQQDEEEKQKGDKHSQNSEESKTFDYRNIKLYNHGAESDKNQHFYQVGQISSSNIDGGAGGNYTYTGVANDSTSNMEGKSKLPVNIKPQKGQHTQLDTQGNELNKNYGTNSNTQSQQQTLKKNAYGMPLIKADHSIQISYNEVGGFNSLNRQNSQVSIFGAGNAIDQNTQGTNQMSELNSNKNMLVDGGSKTPTNMIANGANISSSKSQTNLQNNADFDNNLQRIYNNGGAITSKNQNHQSQLNLINPVQSNTVTQRNRSERGMSQRSSSRQEAVPRSQKEKQIIEQARLEGYQVIEISYYFQNGKKRQKIKKKKTGKNKGSKKPSVAESKDFSQKDVPIAQQLQSNQVKSSTANPNLRSNANVISQWGDSEDIIYQSKSRQKSPSQSNASKPKVLQSLEDGQNIFQNALTQKQQDQKLQKDSQKDQIQIREFKEDEDGDIQDKNVLNNKKVTASNKKYTEDSQMIKLEKKVQDQKARVLLNTESSCENVLQSMHNLVTENHNELKGQGNTTNRAVGTDDEGANQDNGKDTQRSKRGTLATGKSKKSKMVIKKSEISLHNPKQNEPQTLSGLSKNSSSQIQIISSQDLKNKLAKDGNGNKGNLQEVNPKFELLKRNLGGDYPLHRMILQKNFQGIIQAFKEGYLSEKEYNERDMNGNTPVMLAGKMSHQDEEYLKLVNFLLKYNCNGKLRDTNRWSLLDEAVCQQNTRLLAITFDWLTKRKKQKWEKNKAKMIGRLKKIPDFYLQMHWECCSNWIPFLSKIAPSDDFYIWKIGSSIRLDFSLVGFSKLQTKRRRMSIIFRDNKNCKDPHKSVDIIMINNDKKILVNPMEELDQDEVLAVLTDIINSDPIQNELNITDQKWEECTNFLGKPKKENLFGYPCNQYRVVVTAKMVAKQKLKVSEKITYEEYFLNSKNQSSVKNVDQERKPGQFQSQDPKQQMRQPSRGNSASKDIKNVNRSIDSSLWLSKHFPLKFDQFMEVLDTLAVSGNASMNKMNEFLDNDALKDVINMNGFPVKVQIPIGMLIKATVTFNKFEFIELPQSSKDSGGVIKETAIKMGGSTAKSQWDNIFDIPSDYKFVTRKEGMKTMQSKKKRLAVANMAQ